MCLDVYSEKNEKKMDQCKHLLRRELQWAMAKEILLQSQQRSQKF